MSRLDDELRNAFRREPPPADFTARVLERIARQPAPRLQWWKKLTTWFEPPKLRWVAIGVTASLLLAVGAAQYSRLRRAAVNENAKVASVPGPDEADSSTVAPDRDNRGQDLATPGPGPNVKRGATSSKDHRLALARYQKELELRAEGEAAKQKLMLALSIASSTLNNAERAIRDEGPTP